MVDGRKIGRCFLDGDDLRETLENDLYLESVPADEREAKKVGLVRPGRQPVGKFSVRTLQDDTHGSVIRQRFQVENGFPVMDL
jgi:hypothetical protein